MSVWKRNAVVVAIVLFVGAAVYLNWSYGREAAANSGTADPDGGGKLLGQAALVNGKEGGKQGEDGKTDAQPSADPSAQPSAAGEQTGYFASARLTRQQARDNAISLLQEAAEQENADTAVANEASQGIQVLASYTLAEAQIENLVTAKGYTDCVAFMGDECVSVVVSTKSGDLTAEDVAKITDITMTETGLPAGNIKIMAAN